MMLQRFSLVTLSSLLLSVSAKSNTAVLHIHKGRGNTAVITSRGAIPELGEGFEKVEDASTVLTSEGSDTMVLDGTSFGTTGGGLIEKSELFTFPTDSVTTDWEACAGLDLNLEFDNKDALPVPLLGVLDEESGSFLMLPFEKKSGTSISGRAVIENRDATPLEALLEEVEAYTTCSHEWTNADGEAQRIEIVFGKDLTIVSIIIFATLGLLVAISAFAFLCCSGGSSE